MFKPPYVNGYCVSRERWKTMCASGLWQPYGGTHVVRYVVPGMFELMGAPSTVFRCAPRAALYNAFVIVSKDNLMISYR